MRPCHFFYNVSGEEAERLLSKYAKDGEFLARPSESQPSNCTLSIKRSTGITHVKVSYNNGKFLGLPGGDSFDSLSELVEHYIKKPDQLQETNGSTIVLRRPVTIPLTEPAAHEVRAPTAERWFHVNLTGQEAEKLLEKEKIWTFLVRDSQRAPGSYVISVKTQLSPVHILIEKNSQTGMYSVGGGDEFSSVRELLAHYNLTPMVEQETQRVVHLMTLIPSTCVPADAISERIRLLAEIDPNSKKNGFAEEFERIQQPDDHFLSRRTGRKDQNVLKNRYKNIVPFDHTRVVLREDANPKDGRDTDYINASYIKIPSDDRLSFNESVREYIATQGCLESTVVDFWRMIWQENTRILVMTTREVEHGKSKCFQYWPNLKETQNLRGFSIKNVEEVHFTDDKGDETYVQRIFELSKNNKTVRTVHHMQFVGWPDHGRPEQPEPVLQFLDAVDKIYKGITEPQGPVVVHCSAGIGRTGTFIMIDVLLNQIRTKGLTCPIDIPSTLMMLRKQRGGMVQTLEQYTFLYKSVNLYVSSLIRTHLGENYDEEPTPAHLPPPPVPRRQKAYVCANPEN